MEKEISFNGYSDKRPAGGQQQPKPTNYNAMPFYQTSLATSKLNPAEPHNIVGISSNDLLQRLTLKSSSLLYKTVENRKKIANNEIDKVHLPVLSAHFKNSAITDKRNQPKVDEAKTKYYNVEDDGDADELQIVDYEDKVSNAHQYHIPDQMRQLKNQRETIHPLNDVPIRSQQQVSERNNQNLMERLNEPETGSTSVRQTVNETAINLLHQNYDFSIPFNESNILIKVMSPDEKKQRNLGKRLPQVALKNKMEKKPKLDEIPKKYRFEAEKTTVEKYANQPIDCNEIQSKWTDYIRNIIKKNQNKSSEHKNEEIVATNSRVLTQPLNPVHSVRLPNDLNNQRYFGERYVGNDKLSIKPDVTSTESANFYNSPLNEQIRQNRPFTNATVIKPKVWHPSQYFHSDGLQHNSPYNSDDTNRAPLYPLLPHISEGPTMSQPLDYLYNNHPANYHPNFNMFRRICASNNNRLMRPPNDQAYAFTQYRNELEPRMEQMPPQSCIDPYIRNDMHIPLNLSLNYSQPRPTVDPRIYGYLNEPPIHPMWFYQHISER